MGIKCSVFIATSLDGFIARLNGELDWLDAANAQVPPDQDCGYAEFFSSIDTLVMGRHTFEVVQSFGEWPYRTTPVVVLSRSMSQLPAYIPPTVSLSSEPPQVLVDRLAQAGRQHLYVDGGMTIQRFLMAGLIDELMITRIPVLLGTGKSLFGPLPADVRLNHIYTNVFDFGFVQSKYCVVKPNQAMPERKCRQNPSSEVS